MDTKDNRIVPLPVTDRQSDEVLWDLNDCARYVRRSKKTVRRWAREGKIPSRRVGGRILFVPDSVRQWVKDLPAADAA